ncbi:MAG: methyltransferase [Porticoccus sp.]|jgi:2-polyprenyl-3-methyl-5-hydroxy-6-metoxy-1,4-benzoquinol methylase|uniref:class I SAM-dependent methyltransferase n=1 Tax=Porticoccus TaxID=1123967 RepID=UPI000C5F6231|nr:MULTISPECIES: class I SAM-dependent methyltransferase [Porticoccus]MAZ70761.1 methyltransferase [Porticoccus sp.]MBG58490.1 methyltransferase [Porticoccus sp.]|tara:strand:+ start:868 stop:1515 length:648 start_codon:yes stop_codon:yes gene_type:complete
MSDRQYYRQARPEMLDHMAWNVGCCLEVGCGSGNFAQLVKKHKNVSEYWGIEIEEQSAKEAKKTLNRVLLGNAEELVEQLPNNYFDTVVFNDSLEHLVDPLGLLKIIKTKLTAKGHIVASIPNVRYYKNLYNLIFKKQWCYEDSGILDRTHLRFFTQQSIIDTFAEAGFNVNSIQGVNGTRKLKIRLLGPLTFGLLGDISYLQFAVNACATGHKV